MRIFTPIVVALLTASFILPPPPIQAAGSKLAVETVQLLMKKFGKEVLEEGAEKLTSRLAATVARYGDDVIKAVRRVGPKAIKLVDDAGPHAPQMIRLITRYGDDAVRAFTKPQTLALVSRYGDDAAVALIKHPGVAIPLLEKAGEPAAKALMALGPQNGRRLAMLGFGDAKLLGVIAKHGENAMEFVWKHKVALGSGAALAAFVANPDPYLNGAKSLLEATSEHIAKPMELAGVHAADAAGKVAKATLHYLFWGITIGTGSVAVLLWLLSRSGVLTKLLVKTGLNFAVRYIKLR